MTDAETILIRAFWFCYYGDDVNVINHGREIVLQAIEDGRIGQDMLELYDEISVLWRKSVAADLKRPVSKRRTQTAILNELLDIYQLPQIPVPRPALRFVRGGKA